MIPKIIHYCWFGSKELPELVKKCIATWHKHLPDYEFKLWNEETFDINSSEWCIGAYKEKKYAFVSDYVRLKVLYEYGGIYLDTDIKILKSFNSLLESHGLLGFEDIKGEVIASCIMGFEKEHSFIKECLEYYNQPFTLDIIKNNEANVIDITNRLRNYGLILGGMEQIVDDIKIYPREYFCPMDFWGNWNQTKNTYCIHLFNGSWLPVREQKKLNRRKTWWWKGLKWIKNQLSLSVKPMPK